jgi:zinc transporter
MYALSVIAGIFLPLTFVTGLLGINVAGIWGAESDRAFDAVFAGLVVLGVVEVILFRLLRWL